MKDGKKLIASAIAGYSTFKMMSTCFKYAPAKETLVYKTGGFLMSSAMGLTAAGICFSALESVEKTVNHVVEKYMDKDLPQEKDDDFEDDYMEEETDDGSGEETK